MHVHLVPGEAEHEHHAAIPEESAEENHPDTASKSPPVKQVITREEGAGSRVTVNAWRERKEGQ